MMYTLNHDYIKMMKSTNSPKTMINTVSVLLSASALLVFSNTFAADQNTGKSVAYVDSIHKWGAWELDLEPAAGGISPPGTRPLAARDTKVQLRSNSFSGLGPSVTIAERPATPVNPVIPVNPTPPPTTPPVVTPPAPVVPPIGGPADGLF